MESLCLKTKLTRKTKRKVKSSYNSVAVCITEDDFVTKYKHDKEQKKEDEKQQPKGGRKKQTSTRPTKSTSAVTASNKTKSTSDLVLLEPQLEPNQRDPSHQRAIRNNINYSVDKCN